MHPVDRALARAYQHRPPELTIEDCKRILMARTPGLADATTPYEELAVRYLVTEGTLRGVVKQGSVAEWDLFDRGLIAEVRRAPRVAEVSVWRAPERETAA